MCVSELTESQSFVAPSVERRESDADEIVHLVEQLGDLLPAQGPITVFVHHNTLHAFEDQPFDQAVMAASNLFGCEPYLSEARYREELSRGRIRPSDIEACLTEDLRRVGNPTLPGAVTRWEFRRCMLMHSLTSAPEAELRWHVATADTLSRLRPDVDHQRRQTLLDSCRRWMGRGGLFSDCDHEGGFSERAFADLLTGVGTKHPDRWLESDWERVALHTLWGLCQRGVGQVELRLDPPRRIRHRDWLLEATGADADLLVHDRLVRFTAAFLDQGLASWPIHDRNLGFLAAFRAIHVTTTGLMERWLVPLRSNDWDCELALPSAVSILVSLEDLGVPREEWRDYLAATLLALRGWAGMIRQMELRTDRVAVPIPKGSLMEFLALRLVLDRLAIAHLTRETLGSCGPLAELKERLQPKLDGKDWPDALLRRAYRLFQLAQLLEWDLGEMAAWTREEWEILVRELESFSHVQRRRLLHAAYERQFRQRTLDALTTHSASRPTSRHSEVELQVLCCIDEREESFRRHLEEQGVGIETWGVPGFFNVPMYYRGAADAHFVPLCPIVVKPAHWVTEEATFSIRSAQERRTRTRRWLGYVSRQVHQESRGFAIGTILSAGLGILATLPLVARVLFPRATGMFASNARRWVDIPPSTRLSLDRLREPSSHDHDHLGFTLNERATLAENLLRPIGFTSGFARLVMMLGHGSHSLNNPHQSAYDCGACGGNGGGPNARAAAAILNDRDVRAILAERGIVIPADTVFVGGVHNTCSDSVSFFDLDLLPRSHEEAFARATRIIEIAGDRNARERCRRFQSAPLDLAAEAARRHVEERSEDLAQTRPECGHATNAIAVVGRRSRTRGLFMDRRAFLVSYDPIQDDAKGTLLTRLLQAVVPVCGGINLEYYFSYVDPVGWGCGTKLPHNITSLLGVMDGAASDLRPGLPWQMVEIHEPVRLLFAIETTPTILKGIFADHKSIGRLAMNQWIWFATIDPDTAQIHLFRDGQFEPYAPDFSELPRAATSWDWYRGFRDHLEFASIHAGLATFHREGSP